MNKDKKKKLLDLLEIIHDEIYCFSDFYFELEYLLNNTPRYKEFSCTNCNQFKTKIDIIENQYFTCPKCKQKYKLRGYGPKGLEVYDFILLVKSWIDNSKNSGDIKKCQTS